jgi:peptide methionine sulfoxide reductase msrA/msrB
MEYSDLTPEEKYVIEQKGTERPFTGEYVNSKVTGIYICKRCRAPLYNSRDKFDSGCGWPSFDDEIAGAVKKVADADGRRTEIVCNACGAHLGHVFTGEQFTKKNTRHCVNSISLVLIPEGATATGKKIEKAIFAGGCFWGVEYYFQKLKGVISTVVGYTGGHKENPTYREVCYHSTGHIEAIEITYDANIVSYEELTKLFFEIHNPEQSDGQGPDIGEQYTSVVFYQDVKQKEIAEHLIEVLKGKGYKVATKLRKAAYFWPAEKAHQQYYEKEGSKPYCHHWQKRF